MPPPCAKGSICSTQPVAPEQPRTQGGGGRGWGWDTGGLTVPPAQGRGSHSPSPRTPIYSIFLPLVLIKSLKLVRGVSAPPVIHAAHTGGTRRGSLRPVLLPGPLPALSGRTPRPVSAVTAKLTRHTQGTYLLAWLRCAHATCVTPASRCTNRALSRHLRHGTPSRSCAQAWQRRGSPATVGDHQRHFHFCADPCL